MSEPKPSAGAIAAAEEWYAPDKYANTWRVRHLAEIIHRLAVQPEREVADVLRRQLANPSLDMQEWVIKTLDLVHRDAVKKVEQERDQWRTLAVDSMVYIQGPVVLTDDDEILARKNIAGI